jgi:hypothetical protein
MEIELLVLCGMLTHVDGEMHTLIAEQAACLSLNGTDILRRSEVFFFPLPPRCRRIIAPKEFSNG